MMLFSDCGFRPIYNHFCLFEKKGILDQLANDYLPNYEEADYILTYGYIDRNMGLSIEVLACCKRNEDGKCCFFAPNNSIRTHARIAAVENIPFIKTNIPVDMAYVFSNKMHVLDQYAVSDDIEYSRTMEFLDSSRDIYNIDNILVYFVKNNFKVETCWVKIERLQKHSFIGTLLENPIQHLGCHLGDQIVFRVEKDSSSNIRCFCYL